MSRKCIIAIVGMPGAGKSEASNFFKAKNIPVIRFGEITDNALRKKGLPQTQEHEKAFREDLRQELGMAAFAIKSEQKIRDVLSKEEMLIVDGLRSWEEYEYLKNKFTNLYLLAIFASPRARQKRLRERKERSLATAEEAVKRDISEVINLHMGPPIALADQLIMNETTLDEFHKQLEGFLETVKK